MNQHRPYVEITWPFLGVAAGLLLLCIVASRLQKLRMERDLALGTIRSFAQLMVMGYVLDVIFDLDNVLIAIGVLLLMTLAAAHTASGRTGRIRGGMWVSYVAIGVGGLGILAMMVFSGVIRSASWYVIPIGGMVLKNAMNGVALLLNRLKSEYDLRRGEIEAALSLGAVSGQAVLEPRREAVRAAMIPTVNDLLVLGVVALPGMMTGQIIAGHPAMQAVRYQLVVMYMITASVMASVLIAAALSHRKFFTRDDRFADDM
jgi:putative ABC transport system permease protein